MPTFFDLARMIERERPPIWAVREALALTAYAQIGAIPEGPAASSIRRVIGPERLSERETSVSLSIVQRETKCNSGPDGV